MNIDYQTRESCMAVSPQRAAKCMDVLVINNPNGV